MKKNQTVETDRIRTGGNLQITIRDNCVDKFILRNTLIANFFAEIGKRKNLLVSEIEFGGDSAHRVFRKPQFCLKKKQHQDDQSESLRHRQKQIDLKISVGNVAFRLFYLLSLILLTLVAR